MKKVTLYLLAVPLFVTSCLTLTGEPQNPPKQVLLEVVSGSVSVRVDARMHKRMELESSLGSHGMESPTDERRVLIDKDAVRLSKELVLSTNQKFDYLLADSEAITFQVDPVGEKDAEVIVHQGGESERYRIPAHSMLGLIVSIRN